MPAAPTNVAPAPTPVDGITAISWTLSADDSSSQQSNSGVAPGYNGDISTDNGTTWQTLFTNVPAGTSLVSVDCTGIAATTQGLIRVRFYDGLSYSSYGQSSAFSVVHSPRMLFPIGGETFAIGVSWTLRWSPASDPTTTQDQMKYHLQISTNQGGTWADIVALTSAGVTSYSYNFAGLSPTGQAMIRIQAQNPSGTFTAYSTTRVFNLITETAPLASNLLSPNNNALIDNTIFNRFSWAFNCLGDIQLKFDFKYSTNGGSSFTTVTITSANPYFDVPPLLAAPGAATVAAGAAGTPNGTYKCQVTFVTALGETIGGTEATVTVTNQKINWSNIPLGPAGTLSRNLYRTVAGGASGTEKLAQSIADNTTTSFTGDNVADGSLGAAVPTTNTSGFPTGPLIWKVNPYNQASQAAPDSAQANVQVSRKPTTPVITSPTNGGTVTVVRPTMTWTYTAGALDSQVVFTARVTDSTGLTELWNSGPIRGTQTSIQVGVDMLNGSTRLFKLTVTNADGFTSLEASNSATISLSVPPQPTLTVTADQTTNGRNIIKATNPAGAPAAAYNELWRLEVSTGIQLRLPPPASQLVAGTVAGRALNGTYSDYTMRSGQSYQYWIRSYAVTGTYKDSANSASVPTTLTRGFIHNVASPDTTITGLYDLNQDDVYEYQMVTMELKGSSAESCAFGNMRRRVYKVSSKAATSGTDYSSLSALFNMKAPVLCYRDDLGHKVFGALAELPATYSSGMPGVIATAVELNEVAFSEGV